MGTKVINCVHCHVQLSAEVFNWCRVQKLMKLIDHTCLVKQVRREPLDTWVHDSGRVVLVGDACHPMPVRPSCSAQSSLRK
jgi:hypothetical protein